MTETVEPGSEPAGRKLTPRIIVIVAVVAVLVLAGAGTGIYFLTKGGDDPAASSSPGPASTGSTSGPASGPATQPSTGAQPGGSGGTPADTGQAKSVAEQAVKAFNSHDAAAMMKVSCDQTNNDPIENIPQGTSIELVSPPELTGDTATVELKLTIGDTSSTIPLPLRKKDGTWCVD
ncbi:MAG TPA: hypothetical protein VGR06_04445 [Actinophytocola sp.]|jgi:hypothetical protein|uniref:hypothetical protein n=1 Tax=Actinophytocola sp. TaxID=1872138 RepID=UPI002E055687|nr:hypothetical protein [Actinophytocola sp.]